MAYDSSKLGGQSTAGIDFRVDNRGLVADIVAPPSGTRVAGSFPVTVAAAGADSVRLRAGTLDLGSAAAPSP